MSQDPGSAHPGQGSEPVDRQGMRRRQGGLVPPRRLLVFLLVCAVLVSVFWCTVPWGDSAISNIVVLIVSFFGVVSLLTWFAFQSGYPRGLRVTVSVVCVLGIISACMAVRVKRLSGNLVPDFVPRWSKSRDALLQENEQYQGKVDLTATSPLDFPQFLGLQRDQRVRGLRLARDWSTNPPKVVWRREIGAGWSAFSAVGGFAVTLEQRGPRELISCYDIRTGKLAWWHAEMVRFSEIRSGVGPRATPVIDQGKVYALGATGILVCLDGSTGSVIWKTNVLEDVGTTVSLDEQSVPWGRSGSPLLVQGLVIVAGGGPTDGPWISLMAYDSQTGAEVWRVEGRQISYSSPQLAELDGLPQVLIVNEGTVSGHDVLTGEVLWEEKWFSSSSNQAAASQPVPLQGNKILLTKGYGLGAKLLELARDDGGEWRVEELWHNRRVLKTKLTNVCVRSGFIYGLNDGILECVDLTDGKRRWRRGRFGHGQILLVDDLLLVQSEKGEVALVEAQSERFRVLGKVQAVSGQTWNHLCLYGRFLLVRSDEEAACLELPLAEGLQ